jgi:hypothetical protein
MEGKKYAILTATCAGLIGASIGLSYLSFNYQRPTTEQQTHAATWDDIVEGYHGNVGDTITNYYTNYYSFSASAVLRGLMYAFIALVILEILSEAFGLVHHYERMLSDPAYKQEKDKKAGFFSTNSGVWTILLLIFIVILNFVFNIFQFSYFGYGIVFGLGTLMTFYVLLSNIVVWLLADYLVNGKIAKKSEGQGQE